MSVIISIVGFITLFAFMECGMQVIWQRANITYYNKSHVHLPKLYVNRFGRKSGYFLNVEGANLQSWGNNVSFHLVFYESLHNEYRRSFVELHYDRLCDKLGQDKYVGQQLRNAGLTCPLPAGHKYLMNMTTPTATFPHVWPFQEARVELELVINKSNITMARGYIYVSFVQKKAGSS